MSQHGRIMKILILGNSQAGKTTSASILGEYLGCSYADTSEFIIRDFADHIGISPDEIKSSKDAYRKRLFKFGRERQAIDPLWPQEIQLKHCCILTGLRNKNEIEAARDHNLYDLIIWIERPGYGPNDTDTLTYYDADIIVHNDGTIDRLKDKLIELIKRFQQ